MSNHNQSVPAPTNLAPLEQDHLPDSVRSRFVESINGLRFHILEAGFDEVNRPMVLLLHGFPELAYSWRKVMPALAAAGYHVVAPDQRGYGRTTGAGTAFDDDLDEFRILNLVRDQLALLGALGRESVDMVAGHDFGSSVAFACAVSRPDVFRSLVMMSAPCAPLPAMVPGNQTGSHTGDTITGLSDPRLDEALATLNPPRKHYQWYYSTPQANNDMLHCEQGLHAFLRAYYHHKSADWSANQPYPLSDWSAEQMGVLPTYYVMNKDEDMAQTVAPHMPGPDEIAACQWLPDNELSVYAGEYGRTGFQGGLQAYRVVTSGMFGGEMKLFAGTKISVPTRFISGANDWGIHQKPGSMEAMETRSSLHYLGTDLVADAGHWVQQEQPEKVIDLLLHTLQ